MTYFAVEHVFYFLAEPDSYSNMPVKIGSNVGTLKLMAKKHVTSFRVTHVNRPTKQSPARLNTARSDRFSYTHYVFVFEVGTRQPFALHRCLIIIRPDAQQALEEQIPP